MGVTFCPTAKILGGPVPSRAPPADTPMLFFLCKTFVKQKNSVAYKASTLTYFQRSVQRHLNTKGSTVNLLKEVSFELLNFLEKC